MMMALRNSPSEHALFAALDGAHPRRGSRALTVAIGASICFHVGLVAYLAIERMGGLAPLMAAEAPTTDVSIVRLPTQPPPTHPRTTEHQPPVTHTPPTLPVRPVQTIQPLNLQRNVTTDRQSTLTDLHPFTPPAHMITDPRWLSRPSAAEMSRFYPQTAIDRDLTGQAQLICGVVASGKLVDCKVLGETPASAGFGPAALKLAPFFRMTPKTVDGEPVDGGVTKISIAFTLN